MGVVEGNKPATDNDWESITKGGDKAIQKWIDDQLTGKSCNVVLIGENTAGRKWIKYEIKEAWNNNKGVVGVYIHRLKDLDGNQSSKGRNPFEDFTVGEKKTGTVIHRQGVQSASHRQQGCIRLHQRQPRRLDRGSH